MCNNTITDFNTFGKYFPVSNVRTDEQMKPLCALANTIARSFPEHINGCSKFPSYHIFKIAHTGDIESLYMYK